MRAAQIRLVEVGQRHVDFELRQLPVDVTRIATAASLEGRWRGHSLRRGFATAARRAGAHLERIGRHGGWADGSTALLGYIEEADR
ncbi:tyrosine-type recombinase/integrase [Streptosporangium sp. NPDC002721]|uniref:tyrosine-type recombinase/integrase n=1 Tax=Streptosporangium sp. NPDC002721 TaxID=3366188 RepID=UPI0036A99F3B